MIKVLCSMFLALSFCNIAKSQIDPTLLKSTIKDTSNNLMNMDAVYSRPFINVAKTPVSIGGYVEANWQRLSTDGISEGHQFQFRRMTLFVASTISRKIKFLSEIELEPAEKEIAIEFAAVDIEFHPLANLRAGMILNPIGAFNQNHDGPKWEFTDRPASSTTMLPSTWSNVGFGLYGKYYNQDWMIGYEAYLSSGFDNSIIENSENKTFLPASKQNTERFEELASGYPLITAKLAFKKTKIGEIGVSYMGGIYNKWKSDGIIIDDKRRLDVFAIDFSSTIAKTNTSIIAEVAFVKVNVPSTYTEQFGKKQKGGFIDIVQPILKKKILDWHKATLNIACRLEYVDWNIGHFKSSNTKIGDNLWSIMPAISFRPTTQTVLRINYKHQQQKDILNNPSQKTGGFILGISTYF